MRNRMFRRALTAMLVAVGLFGSVQPAQAVSTTGVVGVAPHFVETISPYFFAIWRDRAGAYLATDGHTVGYVATSESLLSNVDGSLTAPWPGAFTSWSQIDARVGGMWRLVCARTDVHAQSSAIVVVSVSPACVVPAGAVEVRLRFVWHWHLYGPYFEPEQSLTLSTPIT